MSLKIVLRPQTVFIRDQTYWPKHSWKMRGTWRNMPCEIPSKI